MESEKLEDLIVRDFGRADYQETLYQMRNFTENRTKETTDELWFVEHDPIFTQGQAGKAEHLLFQTDIPVYQSDRGGQITYHGPGQLVVYLLMDIRRKNLTARALVHQIEEIVIDTLADYEVESYTKADAPGVYVNEHKICSLGLRIKKGCTYHGLALNVAMDLDPFLQINPCGYSGLKMVQLKEFLSDITLSQVKPNLLSHFKTHLQYN